MTSAVSSTVVILDYGSQYTQLITRRIREVEVYSILLPGDCTFERIFRDNTPSAIILSGGPNSVHVEGAPQVPDGFWNECERMGIPAPWNGFVPR
jgi:GMP synthase (glutamine-hydrolysing)